LAKSISNYKICRPASPIAFEAATQFHHSNTKLPFSLEKFLNLTIVTPGMHGIYHPMIRKETDSNYSIIFFSGTEYIKH
jgi:hypothetical protein